MQVTHGFFAIKRRVGRGNDLGVRHQRMIGGRGFLLKDIQPSAAYHAVIQRIQQRGLVNETAAGGVDEKSARFHHRQGVGVDEVAGAV